VELHGPGLLLLRARHAAVLACRVVGRYRSNMHSNTGPPRLSEVGPEIALLRAIATHQIPNVQVLRTELRQLSAQGFVTVIAGVPLLTPRARIALAQANGEETVTPDEL
jgi:hypothetical protein